MTTDPQIATLERPPGESADDPGFVAPIGGLGRPGRGGYRASYGAQVDEAELIRQFVPVVKRLALRLKGRIDRPPLKWSTVSYVFCSKEGRDAEEDLQAGRDRREAAAG